MRNNGIRYLCLMGVMSGLLLPSIVNAQSGTLGRYRASETTEDDFHLSRPGDFGDMRLSAQLHLDYGLNPLVFERTMGDASTEGLSIVEHQLTGTLGLAFGLFDRLVVFAGLPVALVMDGAPASETTAVSLPAADGAGLGDVYLGARGRIWGDEGDLLVLGAQVRMTLPTSIDSSYRGDPSLTVHPQLLAEVRPAGNLRIVLNVGALFRDETQSPINNLGYGHELSYGVGVGLPVWSAPGTPSTHFDTHLQLYGSSAFSRLGDRDGTALEVTLGGKFFHASGFVGGLAVGPGLTRGLGSPDLRLVGTFGWAMPEASGPVDSDGDGLLDSEDNCPAEPEDQDSFEDEDGCPDLDNDQDGIEDSADQCPNQPETANGFEDEDGCPDALGDSDGDGINDNDDQCPTEPEDVDGFEDENGCPDPDNDADGVPDGDDRCPLEQGPAANQGCPDPDRDGDTVVDRIDNCPDEPGTVENHGCQEVQTVVIGEGGLEILERVHFRTNSATLRPASHAILQSVARVLNSHPEIQAIEVQGHTDTHGTPENNLQLSQARAEAVVAFLVNEGQVSAGRLSARGYGQTRLVMENASNAEEHSQNRRVEFNAPGRIRR